MKLLEIKKLSKKYDNYSSGIDYLRISLPLSPLGEKKVKKLITIKNSINTTNSNFKIIHFREHKVTFFRSSSKGNDTLSAIISFKGISVPLLYFCEYMPNRAQTFKSLGKLEVMGSFFRLIELGFIKKDSELMGWIRDIFEQSKITRLDYRIDFFSEKEKKIFDIKKAVTIGKKDKWTPFNVGPNDSTGWEIGKRKHKRKVVRGYDKLEDTKEKGKFELYEDYFAYESVHRLEYELLNKELEGCTWENASDYISYLLDEVGLKKKESLTIKDVELIFKGQKKIEEIKDYWDYYRKTKSMLKRCIEAGINPFGTIQDCFSDIGMQNDEVQEKWIEFSKRCKIGNTFWLETANGENLYFK